MRFLALESSPTVQQTGRLSGVEGGWAAVPALALGASRFGGWRQLLPVVAWDTNFFLRAASGIALIRPPQETGSIICDRSTSGLRPDSGNVAISSKIPLLFNC